MRKAITLVLVVLFAGYAFAGETPSSPGGSPGMEQGEWSVEPWGNQGAAEKVDSQGAKLLKLEFKAGDKGRTGFKHNTGFSLPKDGKLKLHVYSEQPEPLSLALSTTPDYLWAESKPVELKNGWNKIEFSVDAKIWKTGEAKDWKNAAALETANDVRGVFLIVNNQKTEGTLYVYDFDYTLDDQGKEIQKLIKNLQDKDPAKVSEAEKQLREIGRPATEALDQLAAAPEFSARAQAVLKAPAAPAAPPQKPAAAEERPGEGRPGAAVARPREAIAGMQKSLEELQARMDKLEAKLDLLLQRLEKIAPAPAPAPTK